MLKVGDRVIDLTGHAGTVIRVAQPLADVDVDGVGLNMYRLTDLTLITAASGPRYVAPPADWDMSIDSRPRSAPKACECGAATAKTTHANYCPMHESGGTPPLRSRQEQVMRNYVQEAYDAATIRRAAWELAHNVRIKCVHDWRPYSSSIFCNTDECRHCGKVRGGR